MHEACRERTRLLSLLLRRLHQASHSPPRASASFPPLDDQTARESSVPSFSLAAQTDKKGLDSVRKERKVRAGFTPVEDIARYRPPAARDSAPTPGGTRGRGVPGLGASVLTALGQPNTGSSGRTVRECPTMPRAATGASPPTALHAQGAPRSGHEGKEKGQEKAAEQARTAPRDEPPDDWDASSDEEATAESRERDKGEGSKQGDGVAEGPEVAPPTPSAEPKPTATLAPEEAERRARALRKKLRQVRSAFYAAPSTLDLTNTAHAQTGRAASRSDDAFCRRASQGGRGRRAREGARRVVRMKRSSAFPPMHKFLSEDAARFSAGGRAPSSSPCASLDRLCRLSALPRGPSSIRASRSAAATAHVTRSFACAPQTGYRQERHRKRAGRGGKAKELEELPRVRLREREHQSISS